MEDEKEMICENCAWEADGVKEGRHTHAHIKRVHEKWRAWGGKSGGFGHEACKGDTHCDCQHKEVSGEYTYACAVG